MSLKGVGSSDVSESGQVSVWQEASQQKGIHLVLLP